tara:strand:+ start:110679 stop:110798 length:120 start_codon:yes stop_codon:yes gene_type:complete
VRDRIELQADLLVDLPAHHCVEIADILDPEFQLIQLAVA